MNLELGIYLVDILSTLKGTLQSLILVFSILSLVIILIYCHQKSMDEVYVNTKVLILCFVLSILLLVSSIIGTVLIPSQKTMWSILGIRSIKAISSNSKVQNISNKTYQLIEKKIDTLLLEEQDHNLEENAK